MWFYIMIVTLLLVLMWLTQVREEFIDMPGLPQGLPSLESLPDPTVLLKQMRGLMAKYDKPEVWDGIIQRSDKDPGQLARMNLGINNNLE
jgi:hypothetical protein